MTDLEIAKTVCTLAELEAWTLADRGMSQRAIADALSLSRSAVRARLENARRKIQAAQRKDAA